MRTTPNNDPASERMQLALSREGEAARLKAGGKSYRAIAAEMSIAVSAAYECVQRALARGRERVAEDANELRQAETHKLNELEAAVIDKALDGDLDAVHVCLRIAERRAKLHGIDAPQQFEHAGGFGTFQTRDQLQAQLIKLRDTLIAEGQLDSEPQLTLEERIASARGNQRRIRPPRHIGRGHNGNH